MLSLQQACLQHGRLVIIGALLNIGLQGLQQALKAVRERQRDDALKYGVSVRARKV